MTLVVEELYGVATLVGKPSRGRRRFGVPEGGPWDEEAAALARVLLGNAEEAAVLELAQASVRLRADAETDLAVVGPSAAQVNRGAAVANRAFAVSAGDAIELQPSARGARTYLAVGRGLQGRGTVVKGETLSAQPRTGMLSVLAQGVPPVEGVERFAVVRGPQGDLAGARHLLAQPFSVSLDSSRLGIRLCERIAPHGVELPSECACPGAIQVTPGGEVILLGPDGPTIGGYPKPYVLGRAGFSRLGRVPTGHRVEFYEVSLDEAREQTRKAEARLKQRLRLIGLAQGLRGQTM